MFRALMRTAVVWPALAVALPSPGPAVAQTTDCRLVRVGGHTSSQRFVSRFGPSYYRHYASGGVDYRCSDGTRVLADSAVVFESDNQVQLYGDVLFEDAETELRSDSATYFSGQKQLNAWSNVQVTDRSSGAVINGETLIYDQASEFRALDRITVYGGEPHATFLVAPAPAPPPDPDTGQAEAPPPTTPPPPYEIDAERFYLEGRRYFRAVGEVEIVRDSLRAFGDSLDYDQQVGVMVVLGDARFLGQGYTLTGETISVTPSGSRSEEVMARGDARLTGDQVEMTAPAIRLFADNGNVDRLVALSRAPPPPGGEDELDTQGLSPGDAERVRALARDAPPGTEPEESTDSLPRPTVVAEDFYVRGDSIEVMSPDQRLNQVIALGNARAEAIHEDSVGTAHLPDFARRDWLVGETITAQFGPSQSPDSAAATELTPGDTLVRLRTLTAVGSARSFYRIPSTDTAQVGADTRPALHLVAGEQITIHLDGREVAGMDVEGQTVGYHFEPQPPADSAGADTTGITPDSVAGADTTVVPVATGAGPQPAAAQASPRIVTPTPAMPRRASPRRKVPARPRRGPAITGGRT